MRETRTIKALSLKRKSEGSIGFMTKEEDGKWFNITSEESSLDKLLDSILQKGNIIEFDMDEGFPENFSLKEKAPEQEKNGLDDLTTFEELLDSAHKLGLQSINTEIVEINIEKKYAVFKAKVNMAVKEISIGEYKEMKHFEAFGDATQENCGDLVKKHYIRMAETRAIARALRWATNNAKAAIEETEDAEMTEKEMEEASEEEMARP